MTQGLHRRRHFAALTSLAIACAAFALFVCHLYPLHLPSAVYYAGDAAYAECIRLHHLTPLQPCPSVGFPAGAPQAFGLPIAILASMLSGTHPVTLSTVSLIYGLFVLVGLAGAAKLFHQLVGNWYLALLGAALYFGSATVHGHFEYGELGLGMALIPAYVAADLFLCRMITRRGPAGLKVLALLVMAGIRCWSIFLDGYSFLFSCLLSLACIGFAPLLRKDFRGAAFNIFAYALCCGAAAHIYKSYVSSNALSVMPLSFFRGAGVDVFALLLPQMDALYGRWFGLGVTINPLLTYSDGASLRGTFLGYSGMVAVASLMILARSRPAPALESTAPGSRRLDVSTVAAIFVAGTFALLLSLGPSLKFHDFRQSPSPAITVGHYNMPEQAATADLHTGFIYLQVPGIKNARVLTRWLVLARLALIVALLVVVALLFRRQRRLLAWCLIGWAIFEIIPNASAYHQGSGRAYARAYTLTYQFASSFREAVEPGEKVFILALHDHPESNQYASSLMCERSLARCYNTGGDKASVIAEPWWPRELVEANGHRAVARNIAAAFQKDYVDAVVVPFFDPRLTTYSEAAGAVDIGTVVKRAKELAAATNATVTLTDRFAVLRPRQGGVQGNCGLACWHSWDSVEMSLQWGPKRFEAGKGFNVQVNGNSALWIKISDPDARYSVAVGDHILPTFFSGDVVSAQMTPLVFSTLIPGTSYPVYLLDRADKRAIHLGNSQVVEH